MSPGYGTASVALAATPAVVSTFFTHVGSWPKRRRRAKQHAHNGDAVAPFTPATSVDTLPPQQLRYEEGLHVVRSFLNYASTHGVEEVQDFTAQPVPIPHWVRREVVTIPEDVIDRAAKILTKHLATYGDGKGIELVGGTKWWKVRGRELEAEWIEMSKDFIRRTTSTSGVSTPTHKGDKRRGLPHFMTKKPRAVRDDSGGDVAGDRVILYIHGGAFFFSSLDLHRYQIQRHARKAGARAFVPNYRLSPQYPFPCGLLDSLAAYLYLINPPDGVSAVAPHDIILMGDSAGGGMCLSLLILIREMGLPMPAAASLMSPWVDLTHSMPSIMEWDGGDYIPNVGFHYRPSLAWPPIPGDGIAIQTVDGKELVVDEQVQLYCPNKLLTHPLVSPINMGSFGGLCPLYISAGSVELLRDEVTYIAHKAANPTAFPPSPASLEEYPDQVPLVDKYPPTKVHLQIFEGACHVATTLAWTRSAKHIFRGTANFNIWAFKAARKTSGVQDDSHPLNPGPLSKLNGVNSNSSSGQTSSGTVTPSEQESDVSNSTSEDESSSVLNMIKVRGVLPHFGDKMIVAERVSTHGRITPMEPDKDVPALNPALRPQVGRIREHGPIHTWLDKRAQWDDRFSVQLRHWRKVRMDEYAVAKENGFLTGNLQDEQPPLSSLVCFADQDLAFQASKSVDAPTTTSNTGVALWMKMGEKADEDAMEGKTRRGSWIKEMGRRASMVFDRRGSVSDEKRRSGERSGELSRRSSRHSSLGASRAASPHLRDSRSSPRVRSPLASPGLSPQHQPVSIPASPGLSPNGHLASVPSSPIPPAIAHAPSPLATDPIAESLANVTITAPSPTTPVTAPPAASAPASAPTSASASSNASFATAEEISTPEAPAPAVSNGRAVPGGPRPQPISAPISTPISAPIAEQINLATAAPPN